MGRRRPDKRRRPGARGGGAGVYSCSLRRRYLMSGTGNTPQAPQSRHTTLNMISLPHRLMWQAFVWRAPSLRAAGFRRGLAAAAAAAAAAGGGGRSEPDTGYQRGLCGALKRRSGACHGSWWESVRALSCRSYSGEGCGPAAVAAVRPENIVRGAEWLVREVDLNILTQRQWWP